MATIKPDVNHDGTPCKLIRFEGKLNNGEDYEIEWSKEDSALLIDEKGNLDTTTCDTLEAWWKELTAFERLVLQNDSYLYKTNIYDDVYVNGKIVRKDFNITAGEGPDLLKKVEAAFPDEEIVWTSDRLNVIGTYYAPEGAPLRPPYKTTNSISMYHIRQTIEEYPELLEAFGIDKNQHQWCPWFGLKYDLDNKERLLKVVYYGHEQTHEIPRPKDLPMEISPYYYCFADIYKEGGEKTSERDVFVFGTHEVVKPWCEKNGYDFPIPEDKLNTDEQIWCYGVVYDDTTLEVKQVKGYIRNLLEEDD